MRNPFVAIQFNTKDPYITSATSAIQTKKVHSAKFIIPFQVFTENFQRRVSHATTNFITRVSTSEFQFARI